MTMKLQGTTAAEDYRQYLLKNKGVGIIAIGTENVRVAFSCTEVSDLADLFEKMYEAAEELA